MSDIGLGRGDDQSAPHYFELNRISQSHASIEMSEAVLPLTEPRGGSLRGRLVAVAIRLWRDGLTTTSSPYFFISSDGWLWHTSPATVSDRCGIDVSPRAGCCSRRSRQKPNISCATTRPGVRLASGTSLHALATALSERLSRPTSTVYQSGRPARRSSAVFMALRIATSRIATSGHRSRRQVAVPDVQLQDVASCSGRRGDVGLQAVGRDGPDQGLPLLRRQRHHCPILRPWTGSGSTGYVRDEFPQYASPDLSRDALGVSSCPGPRDGTRWRSRWSLRSTIRPTSAGPPAASVVVRPPGPRRTPGRPPPARRR